MLAVSEKSYDPLADTDFLSRGFQDSPYELYGKMICDHPIFYSGSYRQYFAFSAAAVRGVMVSQNFTVASPFRASRVLFGPTVVDIDGEDHRRLRIALSDAINVRKNAAYREQIIRPKVLDIARALKDGLSQDWVADFCDIVPLSIMSRIIGIPDKDFEFFRAVCGPIIEYIDFSTAETKRAGIDAMAKLRSYIKDLLAQGGQQGAFGETIIGSYLDQQSRLGQPSTEEIIRHVSLLIPAAIDTTNRLIANCIFMLCADSALQQRLRENPEGIIDFVSEVQRFEPPIHTTVRFANCDTEVEGQAIPSGAAVTVNLAAAGRDPSLFFDPNRFDATRAPSNRVLSFGAGKHQCVGKNLAMIEICDCMEALLGVFVSFKFDPNAPVPRITGTAFRSPPSLPIIAEKAKQPWRYA
jgi:cytochrome P450